MSWELKEKQNGREVVVFFFFFCPDSWRLIERLEDKLGDIRYPGGRGGEVNLILRDDVSEATLLAAGVVSEYSLGSKGSGKCPLEPLH